MKYIKYTILEIMHCLVLGLIFISGLRRIQLIEMAEASNDYQEAMKQILMLLIVIACVWYLSNSLIRLMEDKALVKYWEEGDSNETENE